MSSTVQVLSINIGQCGIQVGSALWELMCIEHSISPDGDIMDDSYIERINAFFQECNNNHYSPRVIYVDTEKTVLDDIRSGAYRNLYHPANLISGREDAANNFARGSFYSGTEVLKTFRDTIHKSAELMDCFRTIMIFNSAGGGTGSGTCALFLQQIMLDFPKVLVYQLPIYPGPSLSTGVLEPYNTIFHMHTTMETVDVASIFDNEAIYDMCNKLLFISSPSFTHINRVLATIISSLTCSMRFESALGASLQEFHTNLIPYPRIHFPFMRHAPIQHVSRALYNTKSVDEITRDVFSANHQTIKCNNSRGKYISVLINYRGKISPREMSEAINKQKSNITFVDWCPTGFKVGLNYHPITTVPESEMLMTDKSVTMVTNSTTIRDLWMRLLRKFDLLFDRRAFVHWYVMEGMEETEFNESRMDVSLLIEDYDEISMTEQEIIDALEEEPNAKSGQYGDNLEHNESYPQEQPYQADQIATSNDQQNFADDIVELDENLFDPNNYDY